MTPSLIVRIVRIVRTVRTTDYPQSSRLHDGSVEPDDVVPAEVALGPVVKRREAAARAFKRKLIHAIRRVGRRVPQDVEHLFLSRQLSDRWVLRRVELHVGGRSFVADAVLVLDVQFEMLSARRL